MKEKQEKKIVGEHRKEALVLVEAEVKGLRNSKMNGVPRTVCLFKLNLERKELAF